MKIWIDLANSPQVLFFRPLIPEFEKRGHEVAITTRAFAQTIELANIFRMEHIPIGEHGGKKLGKIGLMERRKKFIWLILCPMNLTFPIFDMFVKSPILSS